MLCLATSAPGYSPTSAPSSTAPYYSEVSAYVNAAGGGNLTHRGSYFELVAPIDVRYGEVWWAVAPTVFPDALAKKFAGRAIAITGFENQVTRLDEATGNEMPVPCSDLYNHHWNLFLSSAEGALSDAELASEQARHGGHGGLGVSQEALGPSTSVPLPQAVDGVPVRQVFSEGNGNEHRGSYHGLPRGYAQLLHSPASAQLLHMSINTRNPDGHGLDPQAAAQPRASNARHPRAGKGWSGLLECPCTTRVKMDRAHETINGKPFPHGCVPGGALERQNNTICSGRTYQGGIQCCGGGTLLLDADQDVPAHTDRYYHKLRVYYEDPAQQKVQNAFRLYWQTEEWMGEYDVPACREGTAPQDCVHTLTSTLRAVDLLGGLTSPLSPTRLNCSSLTDVWCGDAVAVRAAGGTFKLLSMAFHQHSPTVISGELINADTGELICRNVPLMGGAVGESLNEQGYAYGIPPCVWGAADEGLPPPPELSLDTNLLVIAKYNSSVPHYGVMAMWQGRGGL